ncbi:hypothetical protein GCM10009839_43640 [Catenulispora yoronensis]|uniref:Uncharacterized protein n=2 Tax=Catenulispora yoronensis TaxID=450799 RepID=A0ABP5G1T9_9ACTN
MAGIRHATASRTRSARRLAASSAAALASACNTLFPAEAAHAAVDPFTFTFTCTCTGTSDLAHSLGLTYTPQTATHRDQLLHLVHVH